MKIITICNYPDDIKFNAMCMTWAKQIRKHCQGIKIQVLTENGVPPIVERCFSENNVEIVYKERMENNFKFNNSISQKAQHNVFFKMFNLCNENEPYIFIDADAFLLTPIDCLIEASKDKPFIAVNHEKVPNHCENLPYDFLNTGVMIVSDPDFLNFDRKIDILKRDGKFIYPGTDQSLINSYVKEAKYDYSHELVGFGWNHCAGYTEFSDNGAFNSGLHGNYEININHYWYNFKPWNVGCPLYQETLENM